MPSPSLPDEFLNKRSGKGGIGQLIADVRTLPFATLFPVTDWLKDQPWNLAWVRWFAFFAFYPMLLYRYYEYEQFEGGLSLTQVAWAFGIFFAAIWVLILYVCVRPDRLRTGLAFGTAGFTAFIGIGLLLSMQQWPVIRDLYSETTSTSLAGRALGFVFGVGIMEEATKALPLWWRFVYKKDATSPRECAFLGCVSGLAFGVVEAVSYSMIYAVAHEEGALGYGQYLTLQFLRLITLPLLHAFWAGITGYFIGLAATPERRGAMLVVGLAVAAACHGLYDTFSDSWISTGIALLSFLMFICYTRSSDAIVARLRTA